MNNRNEWFEDFQRNVSEMIARSPAGDIERNVKAMMAQTFSRLDLITREEFDVQKDLLERLLERVAILEARVQELEGKPGNDQVAVPATVPMSESAQSGDAADKPDASVEP